MGLEDSVVVRSGKPQISRSGIACAWFYVVGHRLIHAALAGLGTCPDNWCNRNGQLLVSVQARFVLCFRWPRHRRVCVHDRSKGMPLVPRLIRHIPER